MSIAWNHWALNQPDGRLFALETELLDMWHITAGQIPKDYMERYEFEKEKSVQQIREAGHGELIEKYWPHLLSSNPSAE